MNQKSYKEFGNLLERAIRNKLVIGWLRADLPGTSNSLHDVVQGYASYINCPLCEATVSLEDLIQDNDFLEFIWNHFNSIVN